MSTPPTFLRNMVLLYLFTSDSREALLPYYSVTRNYCCRSREVTLSFMDTLIALTYLLTYLLT